MYILPNFIKSDIFIYHLFILIIDKQAELNASNDENTALKARIAQLEADLQAAKN